MQEEARWGKSTPWSVGAEEELMLVDARDAAACAGLSGDRRGRGAELGPGRIKTELFASSSSLNTGACDSAGEAAARLAELRAVAARLAGERGLESSPRARTRSAAPEEQEIVPEARYLAFVEYAGISARRQGVNGLHVHVGMPDRGHLLPRARGRAALAARRAGVSANSPYLSGEETGLASTRAEILAQLPRSGAPPAFRDFAEWEAFVDRLVGGGADPRLHDALVGHPPAPALRDARGPHARPADAPSPRCRD